MAKLPAERRRPTEADMAALTQALADHQVEYVLIGGAAMALHGFPRMTKDIDLFLPVDPENNRRLISALASVPNSAGAVAKLRPKFMDQGYSTAFEGDIAIDLLYVAASKTYVDLRNHIMQVDFNGVMVSTLDVDGMLISKQTNRATDLADRLKLERLRNALFEDEKKKRLENLPKLVRAKSPAVRLFGEMAAASMKAAGAGGKVDWKDLEARVIAAGIDGKGLAGDVVAKALCEHSPGAVMPGRQAAIRKAVMRKPRSSNLR